MSIVVIGLNHRSAPVELRERFAFAETRLPVALKELRESGIAQEAVILSTCNRVEIYAATSQDIEAASSRLKDYLRQSSAYAGALNDEVYAVPEPESLRHLFRVACGMDSMVLGETEILGQIKRAYDLARQHGHTGARLNKAFQRAFNVAKHIRTKTNIQRGNISVASVAVELAEKIFSSLDQRHVMVVGAGDTSEKTARALLSRGARSVIVANRTFDRAQALAAELGGRAVSFEDWSKEFATVDIVVSCTAAPHPILNRTRLQPLMAQRRQRPLLLVDLAVPRDVDPEVLYLENVYLYNVDDLQAIADRYLQQRKEELARCEAIIAEKIQSLLGHPNIGHSLTQTSPAATHA